VANTYTTTDLISDVLLLSHVPLGNNTFTSTQILQLANLECMLPVIRLILSTRGGYYMTYEDLELNEDGLYIIPADCVAGTLANVEIVSDTVIIPVNQLDESEQFSTTSPTSTSYGYFMRGNYVQILPTPNTTGVVRLWFFKRVSKMILTSQASQIVSINGSFDVFTVGSIPSTIVEGSFVDLCGDQPPFNTPGDDIEIDSIAGTDITLAEPVESAEVGDWIALHNQTPIPQIPVEFRLLLAQQIVCKIYELQGYLEKLKAAENKLKEYREDTLSLLTPRVKSQTKIISATNGGFLAGNPNKMVNFPASRSG
jgi:hypothetical protein